MHSIGLRVILVATLVAACSKGGDNADASADTSVAGSASSVPGGETSRAGGIPSSMAMGDSAGGMEGVQGMHGMQMTGDPDHDFLRMMSDHHKGLIAMAHDAVEGNKAVEAKPDARRLDSKQDAELEKMKSMLGRQYNDQYEPRVMPDNQRMLEELRAQPAGKAYDRAFYQHTIMHHRQALVMIDEYLPKGNNAELKQMAEKMKTDQQKEIREFEARISKR